MTGEAKGVQFFGGKPCHFVSIGKGCSIYKDRPQDPCGIYKCAWLIDERIPEWFKPNYINTIIDRRQINGIPFMNVIEAGESIRSDVLSWLVTNALNNNWNLRWTINGGAHWIGSKEFLDAMDKEHK